MFPRKNFVSSIHTNFRFFSSSSSSPSSPPKVRSKIPKDLLRKPSQKLSDLGLGKLEKISLSMKVYLEQARQNAEMINKQQSEFELGKRHLANLMGFDYHNMTENNIKEAIEYLLPSGLFSVRNRPALLAPEDVYVKMKSADFDTSGRPFHYLAYTGKPIFYEDLHNLYANYCKCEELNDKMIATGITTPLPSGQVDLTGSRWVTQKEYSAKSEERLTPELWNVLMASLERLAKHPCSSEVRDFLMKFRIDLELKAATLQIAPITFNEDGRPYVQAEGFRKHCKAQVTLWGNGTGNIDINGYDILYFPQFKERQQILFPLLFSKMLNNVDVEAKVEGIGEAAQAGAIRHGISLALVSFVDQSMIEKMRLAGLLTKDRRVKERKKVGKDGARKQYRWRPR